MLQLALETIGRSGSLAILEGETVRWKHTLADDRRAAAELAVQLDVALRWAENHSVHLDALSVAVGPGSFTGLRIAITTAKSLSYALGLPVIPVGSLAGLAFALQLDLRSSSDQPSRNILVGLNAYRNQVFRAEFNTVELLGTFDRAKGDAPDWIHRAEVVDRRDWDTEVRQRGAGRPDCWITGDAGIFTAENRSWFRQRKSVDAAGIGHAALRIAAAIGWPGSESTDDAVIDDAFSLAANYVKPSAAEEQAKAR